MDSERVEELARNLRGVEKLVLELGDLVMTKKEEARPPQKKARKESESSDEDDLSKLGEKLSLHVLHKHDPKLASAVRWSDVVGCKEAKQAFKEALVRPLRNPELYGPQMLSPAKTILLYGPPGTGKTSLCKCDLRPLFPITYDKPPPSYRPHCRRQMQRQLSLRDPHDVFLQVVGAGGEERRGPVPAGACPPALHHLH